MKKCPRCGAEMQKVDSRKTDHSFLVNYVCKKCKSTSNEMEKK